MRIALHIDSATTEEIRALTVLLHRAGRTRELQVQAEGPTGWSAITPKLREDEWRAVTSNLIGGLT